MMASTTLRPINRGAQLLVLLALIAPILGIADAPSASAATDPGADGAALVMFASDAITIRDGSTVTSNGSTVDIVSQSNIPASRFSVAVRGAASTGADVRVIGDRIKVDTAASIADDVFYDEFLRNDGTIGGIIVDDLTVPVPVTNEPVFRFGRPGTTAVVVPAAGTATITPGDYDIIRVGQGATLTLSGAGDYSTQYVAIENGGRIEVDGGGGDVELLVTNSFRTARNTYFGPAVAALTTAEDIAVFVEGSNPNQLTAGRLRRNTEFHGTLFVALGGPRAAVEENSVLTGAVFGTRISVGLNAHVIAAPFFPSVGGPGDAALSIAKADSADPVAPGDTLTYTVTVANTGLRDAINAVVTDTLPAGVTLVSTTGCSEDPAGAPTCSLGDIASGGSAQYTIQVTVDPGIVGTLTNNASVQSDIVDLNPADNSTFEDTSSESADLSITKTDNVDPVNAGDPLTYTVTVNNAGPGPATNVTVTDTLPAGVTFVSTSGCIEDVGPGGVPTCNLDTIASGSSASFDIDVIVDSSTAAGTITNSASVTSDQSDPVSGNNSITEDTTVTTSADLSISKIDDTDPIIAGNTLTYTVTVDNAGPSDATGVVVTDTLPVGVTFVSTSGCVEDPTGAPTCTLGAIAAGANASYDLVVTVDAGTTGTITNAASVAGDQSDPVPGNDSTTEDTAVNAPSADLSITKTDDVDPIVAGNTLTYTVTVDNAGPSDATGVVVTDTLPAGVTFGSTSGCAEDPSGVATCSLGTIASGANASYTIAVSVDAGTTGTITNSASVTSDLIDPNGANNSTTENTTVNPPPVPPTAVDDGPAAASSPGDDFHTALDTTLTVTTGSQVLLANDTLGMPAATLSHFGGGDLGGAVTANAAAATATFGVDGSLTVNGDGTFVFTPDTGFIGEFSFDYRLTNVAGTSDATVTIAVGAAPTAVADARAALANVGINTSIAPAFSVLDNDTGSAVTVTAMDTASANGGVVAHLGNGQFTYTPAVGFTGSDTFDYTITNAVGNDTATVSISVTDVIWFIDNSAGAAGNGTLATPFNTLAGFETVNGNGGATEPAAGDLIFIDETGNGAYTGGVTLEDNQTLIGKGASGTFASATGVTVPPGTPTLPTVAGSPPNLTATTGDGVTLADTNTIRGINVGDTAGGHAIAGTAVGTPIISDVNVSGLGGILEVTANGDLSAVTFASASATNTPLGVAAIELIGVSGNVNLGSPTVTTGTGEGIRLLNTSANFTFPSVAINGVSDFGVRIEGNTGTINIQGGTIGTTTSNNGGVAIDGTSGSGNITIAAAITSTTNNGINVADRTSGTVTFSGPVVANSGGSHGIQLVNNPGSTINFTGFLDIDTTSGRGLNAELGGAINITGISNSISTTSGTAMNLNGVTAGITFASVDISTITASRGIDITNVSGNITVAGGTINYAGPASAVRIIQTGGAGGANVTINSNLTTNAVVGGAGFAVEMNALTGGAMIFGGTFTDSFFGNQGGIQITNLASGGSPTVTFSGSVQANTGGAEAVFLDNNDSATINFTGGLDLVTSSDEGFTATNGGTVTVQGAGNTVATGPATAVLIQNTTIGAPGVTFESVNVNGGATGINLANAGASGAFTVTGIGTTDGSGGTVQNTSGSGVLLTNVNNVALSNFAISTTGFHGIEGSAISNLDLTNVSITNAGNANNERAVSILNLTSAAAGSVFDGVTINGSADASIFIDQTTAATGNLTVQGSSVFTSSGGQGIHIETNANGASVAVAIGNASGVGVGDTVTFSGVGAGGAVVLNANTGNINATVQNSLFNAGASDLPNAISGSSQGTSGPSNLTLNATGNNITIPDGLGTSRGGIFALIDSGAGGAGSGSGTISNNVINSPEVTVFGISVNNIGTSSAASNIWTISGNLINLTATGLGATTQGIVVEANSPTGTPGVAATVTNNSGNATGGSGFTTGIFLTAGNPNQAGNLGVVCASVSGNTLLAPFGTVDGAVPAGEADMVAGSFATVTMLNLAGLTLGSRTSTEVDTFLTTQNPGTDVLIFPNGTAGAYNGVNTCP